jgi:hypothetical protein
MATILHTEADSSQGLEEQGSPRVLHAQKRESPNRVKDVPRRVSVSHGLSPAERDLLTESLEHMRQRGSGLFVSIEAGRSPDAENIVRTLTRRVGSDIAQRQHRAKMRRVLMTTVFEARDRKKREKFGSHIVAVMPDATARDGAVDGLNGSSAYADLAAGFSESGYPVVAKPVTKWATLMTYLAKEATPQAAYRKGFRRVGGSIPLGVRGGDRVILSRDLRATLVRSGKVEPYRRTYAKRLPKAPALLAELRYRESLFEGELLPVLIAPQRPRPATRKRKKIESPSLQMDYPPTVADLLATLGPTHQAAAERVGLSRPQTTNIICGRFGISRPVARRVLELALAA